jgi:hypothetical protein
LYHARCTKSACTAELAKSRNCKPGSTERKTAAELILEDPENTMTLTGEIEIFAAKCSTGYGTGYQHGRSEFPRAGPAMEELLRARLVEDHRNLIGSSGKEAPIFKVLAKLSAPSEEGLRTKLTAEYPGTEVTRSSWRNSRSWTPG